MMSYHENILSDTSLIGLGTKYNEKDGKWMITMYDARNKKDYSAWTNANMPVGPELTQQQKAAIIHDYVRNNVSKNIEADVIFFYTQRFGKLWTEKYESLKLDSVALKKMFLQQLTEKNIQTAFSISFIDTTAVHAMPVAKTGAFITKPLPVNYMQVNDYRKQYIAIAYVYSPVTLLLNRLWLALAGSMLLLSLTFYCLYRMYKTIIQQKQLDELKNDFIGNMTHELKTPIATVTAAVDGLQYYDGLNNKEKAEKYLNTSRTELQRLNEIVSKVLDISVFEKRLTALHKQPVEIASLFKTVVQAFEVKGHTFTYNIQCSPAGISVVADETHLKNVIYNLVDNAVKYVPAGLCLSLAACKKENSVIISVHDNGDGIDEKYMPRLFEKFYRVPLGNVQNVKGFGLGLFYVKQIVEQHNGTVQVQSDRNNGTTFIIQIQE